MRHLVPLFGDKPRVRLLEALLSLAPYTFTRAEAAQEAGLTRASVNRVFPEIEALGMVCLVKDGPQPTYRVDQKSETFLILMHLDHALGLVESGPESGPVTPSVGFRKGVMRSIVRG